MDRTLSINISEDLFQKLQLAAKTTQRSIADVIINTINATFVAPPDLPAPMAAELAVMPQMKDDALWERLRPSVTAQQQQRLHDLTLISEQRALSPDERDEQKTLLEAHHIGMI